MLELTTKYGGRLKVDVSGGTPEDLRFAYGSEIFTLSKPTAVQMARAILGNYKEGLVPVVKDGELWEDLEGKRWFIMNGSAHPYGRIGNAVWLVENFQQTLTKKVAELK